MLRLFLIFLLAINLNAGIIKKTIIAGAGAIAIKKVAPALKKKVASKVKNSKTVKDLKEKADKTKDTLLGSNGTQLSSKPVWKGNGKERIDVENPNPGQRPGQIHYQDNVGNKFYYNHSTGTFFNDTGFTKPLSKTQNNKILSKPNIKNGIQKALKYLGE